MQQNSASQSGLVNPRVLLALTLCSVGVFLAALGFAATPTPAGWSLITSPSPSARGNLLNDVTCVSASDCWAAGYYIDNGTYPIPHTLIEHWNGTSWSVVPSPNTSATQNNFLYGVACASASDCWAVGNYYHANGSFDTYYQILIQHWDGTSWTIASSSFPARTSGLSSVTCVSASDCWAVGGSIQHWNGTSWTMVSSPNGGGRSVTCASASECWVVGGTSIQRWNGTSWVNVPYIDPSGEGTSTLEDVACASASDCWVVGSYPVAAEENQSFIERWDGNSWAIVPAPIPGGSNGLGGVTCASASECWAIGTYIERWDGSSWAIVPSPNPSGTQNILQRVTCASTSECWVVGYTSGSPAIIEEFAPTIPPLTGVVSRMTHGSVGPFDINLPLIGTRGVECRSSTSLGAGSYTMIFTFVNNVTSCGTASSGSLSSGPGSNQCTVNLTGVANQQYTTVTLNNVLDSQNNTGNVAGTMGVLVGDVNANGVVTNADVSLVKAQVAAGASVGSSNFRDDINANGVLSNADVSLTKAQVAAGAQLPSPP